MAAAETSDNDVGGQRTALKAKADELEAKELYIRRLEARLLAQHKLLQRRSRSRDPAPAVNARPDGPHYMQHRGFPQALATDQAQRDAGGLAAAANDGGSAGLPVVAARRRAEIQDQHRPAAGPVYYVLNPLATEDFQESGPASPLRPPLRAPLRDSVPQKDGAHLGARPVAHLGDPLKFASLPTAAGTKSMAPSRTWYARELQEYHQDETGAGGPSLPARRWDPDVWSPPRKRMGAEAPPPKPRQRPLRRSLPAALLGAGRLRHPPPAEENGVQHDRRESGRALDHPDLTASISLLRDTLAGRSMQEGAAEAGALADRDPEPLLSLGELEQRINALTRSSHKDDHHNTAFGDKPVRRVPLVPTSRDNVRVSAAGAVTKLRAAAQRRLTSQASTVDENVVLKTLPSDKAGGGPAGVAADDAPSIGRGHCDAEDGRVAKAGGTQELGLTAFIMSAQNVRKRVESLGIRPVAPQLPDNVRQGLASQPVDVLDGGAARPPMEVADSPDSTALAAETPASALPKTHGANALWDFADEDPGVPRGSAPPLREHGAGGQGNTQDPTPRLRTIGSEDLADVIIMEEQLGSREDRIGSGRVTESSAVVDLQVGTGLGRRVEAGALGNSRDSPDVVQNGLTLGSSWAVRGVGVSMGEQEDGPRFPSTITQNRAENLWTRAPVGREEPARSPRDRHAGQSHPHVVKGQVLLSRQLGSAAYSLQGLLDGGNPRAAEGSLPASPRLSEVLRDCECDASFFSHSHDVFSSA